MTPRPAARYGVWSSFEDVTIDGVTYKAAKPSQIVPPLGAVLHTLSKLFKTDIRLYASEADKSGKYSGRNGFYKDGVIYVDINAHANSTAEESAVLLTIAHELTHELRESNEAGYRELRDFVIEHMVRSGTDIEQLAREKISESGNPNMSMGDAVEEIVCNASERMLLNTKYAELMEKEKPNLFDAIRKWLSGLRDRIQKIFEGEGYSRENAYKEAKILWDVMDEMQEIWDRAMVQAQSSRLNGRQQNESGTESGTTEGNSGTKSSIREIIDEDGYDYGQGVYLDTPIFNGVKPRYWGKVLGDFIYNQMADKELVMYDEQGNEETVRLARTNDRVKKDSAKSSHKVLDKLARQTGDNTRNLAIVHMSELLKVSQNQSTSEEHSHQWLDENGWIYRVAVIQDKEDNVYAATLNIADGKRGKILYEINNVRPITGGIVSSTGIKNASPDLLTSHNRSDVSTLPQGGTDVKSKFKASSREQGITAKELEDELNNAGLNLRTKDNQKNNDRIYKWIEKNHPELSGFVRFRNNKFEGKVTVDKILTAEMIEEERQRYERIRQMEAERYKRAVAEEKFFKRVRTPSGIEALYSSVEKHINKEGYADKGVTIHKSRSSVGTLSFYVEDTDNDITIKVSDHNSIRQQLEYSDTAFLDLHYFTSTSELWDAIKKHLDKNNEYQQFKGSSREMRDTAEEAKGREESAAMLRRENRILRERIEYWKKQSRVTKEHTLRNTDTLEYARELVKRLDSAATSAEINRGLQEMGAYLLNAENVDWDMLWEHALTLAHSITDDVDIVISDEMKAEREDFESFIKSIPVDVAPLVKAGEIDYSDLKGYPIVHRKSGTTVDDLYQQLQERFGEGIFPDVPYGGDMIDNIKRYADAEVLTKKMHKVIIDEVIFYLDELLPDKMSILPGSVPNGKSAEISAEGVFHEKYKREDSQRLCREFADRGRRGDWACSRGVVFVSGGYAQQRRICSAGI